MTNQEYDEMIARHFAEIEKQSQKRLAEATDLITKFTVLAASKGVILDAESFEYAQTVGIVAKAQGIARAFLGPIRLERDGLLSFNEIASRFPPSRNYEGCFVGPDFILMAHPYYRRGMHPINNWAPRFIDLFWQFNGLGTEKYIALDPDRVRVDVEGSCYIEDDTWFGAPFDQDIRNIKPGIVKLRPPIDIAPHLVSFFFASAYCLDIKWSESNGIKSFQALEIKAEDITIEIGGEHYFPARYLHAEFDLVANCFRHFDGAIQLFTEEEYFQRRDSDFNMTMKSPAHIKARSSKVFKKMALLERKTGSSSAATFIQPIRLLSSTSAVSILSMFLRPLKKSGVTHPNSLVKLNLALSAIVMRINFWPISNNWMRFCSP